MGSVAPTQQSVAELLAAHKFQEAEELQEELDYQEWWASELKEKLQYELELRNTHQVLIRLLALDRLLDSVPLQQQRKKQQQQQQQQNPNLDVILSIENSDPVLQEAAARYTTLTLDNRNLNRIANQVPRSDLIPATLVHICKTSWQGEIFKNVYCHSDMSKSRDPTCSEVLSLLRRFDRALGTRLRVKINAILRSVPPFRFFSLPVELQLHAYEYILPRQPYLHLRHLEPRRYVFPRYDLSVFRACPRMYEELINNFYKDQVLVMNAYDMIEDGSCAFLSRSVRDRLIIRSMNNTTRSYFKKMEIRILDMKDPNTHKKGRYWEAWPDHEEFGDTWFFSEVLEAFPNMNSITVSFEIEENNLIWWTGWQYGLANIVRFLISHIPRRIEVTWDFQPSSHPDLQEPREPLDWQIMGEIKGIVAEDAAERGKTVQLGQSIIKEYIPSRKRR